MRWRGEEASAQRAARPAEVRSCPLASFGNDANGRHVPVPRVEDFVELRAVGSRTSRDCRRTWIVRGLLWANCIQGNGAAARLTDHRVHSFRCCNYATARGVRSVKDRRIERHRVEGRRCAYEPWLPPPRWSSRTKRGKRDATLPWAGSAVVKTPAQRRTKGRGARGKAARRIGARLHLG